MESCAHFNAVAASLLFGLISFGACGGAEPPPAAPPHAAPAETAYTPPVDPSPIAPTPVPKADPATVGPPVPTPAASTSKANDGPDRNMNDIRAVVSSNRDTFRACYDKAAKSKPGIKGTYTLKFLVNPDGSVKTAEADATKSDIHAPELDTCAIAALKALKFPPSKKGMETTVNYPFDFNPKGATKSSP